jgi:putative ABC transport system substrate-binding protein
VRINQFLLVDTGFDPAAERLGQERRAAGFVARILAGRQPAELPVEQVERFELVLNGDTARLLGVKLSPSIQQRIDELI